MNPVVSRIMSSERFSQYGAQSIIFVVMAADLGRSFGAFLGLSVFTLSMGSVYAAARFEEREQIKAAHRRVQDKLREIEESAQRAEARRVAALEAVQRYQSDR